MKQTSQLRLNLDGMVLVQSFSRLVSDYLGCQPKWSPILKIENQTKNITYFCKFLDIKRKGYWVNGKRQPPIPRDKTFIKKFHDQRSVWNL